MRSASTSSRGRTTRGRWRASLLDLAPEAPWRCPENCAAFQPRLADVGWVHGSLVEPAIEDEPDVPAEDIVSVLGSAEEIVNEVAPEVIAEVEGERADQARKVGRKWWRFGR